MCSSVVTIMHCIDEEDGYIRRKILNQVSMMDYAVLIFIHSDCHQRKKVLRICKLQSGDDSTVTLRKQGNAVTLLPSKVALMESHSECDCLAIYGVYD